VPGRFGYSRWDGTQEVPDLDAEELLAELTDDLLYHGDLDAALRRVLQSGLTVGEQRLAGLREMLERLRRLRREQLERHDPSGAYEDIARELRDVVRTERRALDRLVEGARLSGDERRRATAERLAAERGVQLDALPSDLAGRVRSLESYAFTSPEASDRFEELLARLRRELLQARFHDMAGALSDQNPERLQRFTDMVNDLNHLLELRQAGRDTGPAFEQFMQRHGDFFPGQPGSIDELLEQLASQMAAAQAFLNSMSPEQRAQLQRLADRFLDDLDLRWQLERLRHNLAQALPDAGWHRHYDFAGSDALGLLEGVEVVGRLGEIDELEGLLRSATSPGALADVDLDQVRDLLGADAARSIDGLARISKSLAEAGLLEQREGRLELTPRGLRRIGHTALSRLFTRLARDRVGGHQASVAGLGHERAHQTKPYEFGDPFHLSIERTVRNAVQDRGTGTPVVLEPADFEIERTETVTRTSSVLMLDLSLSMPMRGNFLAAKKVAMALHALISTQYPRDFLGIVAFSEVAREVKPRQLPEVSWDFVYGTNMQHGLMLSRRLLARRGGTKQIIMITDGEPTAHLRAAGEVFFHYPPTKETVDATLAEVARCTNEGIRINTFMLDATAHLRSFVQKLTRLNRGRAFFTTPETLGDYILVDYLEQKKARLGAGRRPCT
jgi:uncharacterized protein with von Willebrand factor type A (vWA) domain